MIGMWNSGTWFSHSLIKMNMEIITGAHPNIDTGMGLERVAAIMQGVDSLFEVDAIWDILQHISKIAGIEYGKTEEADISLRVITDHVRSTVFMVSDGILPSNEGRGYVLRRVLRRACRHGKLLGIDKPFLSQVAKTVIKQFCEAYPELKEREEYIIKIIDIEKNGLMKQLTGMSYLNEYIDEIVKRPKCLDGAKTFKRRYLWISA